MRSRRLDFVSRSHRAGRTPTGGVRPIRWGRWCGQPHHRGSGSALPHGRRSEHTAGMSWPVRVRGRTRHELLWGAIVLGGLSTFVVVTYVVIVLGGGLLVGRTDAPDLALSVLATAVVALAFDPVQTRLEGFAS